MDAALVTTAVAGAWVLLARRSVIPFDWTYSQVLSEAAYYHGIGFLLLLATGLASLRSGTTFVVWTQLGVLLTSIAIFLLRLDALLGEHALLAVPRVWADILTMMTCMACAGLQIRSALRVKASRNVRLLWWLSSLHLLACGALGLHRGLEIELRGLAVEGFVLESTYVLPGFALAAALAWKLARRSSDPSSEGAPAETGPRPPV